MCDYSPFRERAMTVSEDKSWWCDPCIAPLVKALNDAGLRTVASCCGHGQRPGNIFLANGTELTVGQFVPSESKETPMTEYCDEPIEPLTDPGEDRRCGNPEPCPVHHPATRPPRPPACEECDALWTPGHVCAPAARVVVDAATPAATPAADKLEALREAVANYRTAVVARFQMGQTADPMTEIELAAGAFVDAVAAAEQADKGDGADTPHEQTIAEFQAECKHERWDIDKRKSGAWRCRNCGVRREPVLTKPRVPVNDEAEACVLTEDEHKTLRAAFKKHGVPEYGFYNQVVRHIHEFIAARGEDA